MSTIVELLDQGHEVDIYELRTFIGGKVCSVVDKKENQIEMGFLTNRNGAGDDLFKELWRLCVGPLMDVPCVQDRVFYFPQGHIELLPEPTEQDLRQMKNQKSPKYDLPSKILCRVIDVKCLLDIFSEFEIELSSKAPDVSKLVFGSKLPVLSDEKLSLKKINNFY
ncbi:hypothetical protein Ahy_B03g064989 [Arachis hypogaea]|uniref:Amine oxidase domain-containing protein n=1 Tax=Arachis hypogaea TaxID=3818 RepID=A0A445A0Q1_ARAHY|nr:hypothetical protein Ahy_B03g064989 [Arachis hypogaea]